MVEQDSDMSYQRFALLFFFLGVSTIVSCWQVTPASTEDRDDNDKATRTYDEENQGASDTSRDEADSDRFVDDEVMTDMDLEWDTVINVDEGDTEGPYTSDEENVCGRWSMSLPSKIRVMILLDTSASVLPSAELPDEKSRIAQVIADSLQSFGSIVELGFDYFPAGSGCEVPDSVALDSNSYQETAIAELITSMTFTGEAPLLLSMSNFTDPTYAPKFLDNHYPSNLLVIASGDDSCTDSNCDSGPCSSSAEELEAVTKQLTEKGVKTYVVGVGSRTGQKNLNAIASNGGTNLDKAIWANDEESLNSALTRVRDHIVSCTLYLDLNQIQFIGSYGGLESCNLYFDGNIIGYDRQCSAQKGWMWNSEALESATLCRDACDQIKNGTISEVEVKFGCYLPAL
jgi:hypothetical protein